MLRRLIPLNFSFTVRQSVYSISEIPKAYYDLAAKSIDWFLCLKGCKNYRYIDAKLNLTGEYPQSLYQNCCKKHKALVLPFVAE